MKALFSRLFWPILAIFETGRPAQGYRPSHRKILIAVGVLFSFLCGVSVYFGVTADMMGALIPSLIFFAVSLVCLVVALLGSDAAVARIWGSRD
jgi:hypothetical protein